MKIVDVRLTLFGWDDVPPVAYGPNIRLPGGMCTPGLLAITTAEGVTGHAFLGGAYVLRGSRLGSSFLRTRALLAPFSGTA